MEEESKQEPTEAQKKEAFQAELQQNKEANKLNYPEGWKHEPSNVPLRNQKEIWESIKSELKKMIEETDLEIAKQEENKVEERKGQDSLNVETFLLEKIDQIKQSVSRNVKKQRDSPFNIWNMYFSPMTPTPTISEEINVNLSKLNSLTLSEGPQYQSLARATGFFKDVQVNLDKAMQIAIEKSESKKKKKLEEIPQLDEFCKQIQVNVRAMNANLKTFNDKEEENTRSQKQVVDAIRMQLGLQNYMHQIEELSAEEEKFLKMIEDSRKETFQSRKNLTPYKFVINHKYQEDIIHQCMSDEETTIKLQVIQSKKQVVGVYLGEIKSSGSKGTATKEKNNDGNFFKKIFRIKESSDQDSLTQDNFLILHGKFMMHGRGFYFDKETGQLFEGWFKENKLIEGRCILDDEYYVGEFETKGDGKIVKEGQGTCYYSNGTRYRGEWKNDKKHGKGETYFANELKCECQFQEGASVGQRKFTLGKVEHIEEQPVNIEDEQELNKIHSTMVSKSKNAPK